jgi:hypothetical protein
LTALILSGAGACTKLLRPSVCSNAWTAPFRLSCRSCKGPRSLSTVTGTSGGSRVKHTTESDTMCEHACNSCQTALTFVALKYECGKIPSMLVYMATLTIDCNSVRVVAPDSKSSSSGAAEDGDESVSVRRLKPLGAADEQRHLGVVSGAWLRCATLRRCLLLMPCRPSSLCVHAQRSALGDPGPILQSPAWHTQEIARKANGRAAPERCLMSQVLCG